MRDLSEDKINTIPMVCWVYEKMLSANFLFYLFVLVKSGLTRVFVTIKPTIYVDKNINMNGIHVPIGLLNMLKLFSSKIATTKKSIKITDPKKIIPVTSNSSTKSPSN